ncbi:hypothetical protein X956_04065 [Trueperella pyogenes TP8]|uniref:hypothetical protein n=1 Tax=Trueperella pyogenes TaxID=1661 RepID=UPI000581EB9D|nr:hypothetical protein [Trueperella pyogenes]AJC70518.1 hypothetical protein X956_04065 [Trueperella pyogenes TP8]
MVRVESTLYPSLMVTCPKVQFVDGVAEVPEKDADLIRRLPIGGLVIPESEPVKSKSRGKKNA